MNDSKMIARDGVYYQTIMGFIFTHELIKNELGEDEVHNTLMVNDQVRTIKLNAEALERFGDDVVFIGEF